MSRQYDTTHLDHAETQISYAMSGGQFTRQSEKTLREIVKRLRRVAASERRRKVVVTAAAVAAWAYTLPLWR